jgi:hypothetical protein
MGLMDLSTSVASKKHVDFNDARYQSSDKLKQSGTAIRSAFTLYDNKEPGKTSVQDISAAYALSDKRLPIGELLNKMVDLIVDVEEGVIGCDSNSIYTWKYSVALLVMYNDKMLRQEQLSSFDNSLKNSVINSTTFINTFPGKYTSRTNFFDQNTKSQLVKDIVDVFNTVTLPEIHRFAIQRSRDIAENHKNATLDNIAHWAVENYQCEVDSFFQISEDKITKLCFSTNTIILHMNNGYDISIIGYVGTDHDDKFAVSMFDANTTSIESHDEKASQADIQNLIDSTSKNTSVNPIVKMLSVEKHRNDILRQQYEALCLIRPMVPANVLSIKAAESVVGQDYIWGCEQFRKEHDDLPADFKFEDIALPECDEIDYEQIVIAQEKPKEIAEQSEPNCLLYECDESSLPPYSKVDHEMKQENILDSNAGQNLKKKYIYVGENNKLLNAEEEKFDISATLLPNFIPVKEQQRELSVPSVTKQAVPAPQFHNDPVLWKELPGEKQRDVADNTTKDEQFGTELPTLSIENIDSLFE